MTFWEKILKTIGLLEEDEEKDEPEVHAFSSKQTWKKGNVVGLPSAEESHRLIVNNPSSFAEAEEIGGQIKNKKSVVVNLENMDSGEAKRVIDFLSGIVFALNGSSEKISHNIFVFSAVPIVLNSTYQGRSTERDYLIRNSDDRLL